MNLKVKTSRVQRGGIRENISRGTLIVIVSCVNGGIFALVGLPTLQMSRGIRVESNGPLDLLDILKEISTSSAVRGPSVGDCFATGTSIPLRRSIAAERWGFREETRRRHVDRRTSCCGRFNRGNLDLSIRRFGQTDPDYLCVA